MLKKMIRFVLHDGYYLRRQKKVKVEWIGNSYGGFGVVPDALPDNPMIYSFGIGEDVSFDEGMISLYGAEVYGFDPTPKSIEYVKKNVKSTHFHFYDWGISNKDAVENFYLPKNKDYVSGSKIARKELDETGIPVQMFKLKTIMQKLNHSKIDLLKMDIEGSEFAVIPDILSDEIMPSQLCVEVHKRFLGGSGGGGNIIKKLVALLNEHGYYLVWVSDSFNELTFLKCN